MNNSYNFTISNSILQYHKSSKRFRIILSDFKNMSLLVDTDNYLGSNYYVLQRIPENYKTINVNFDACDLLELNEGDLIFTPQVNYKEITEEHINLNKNYAFVLKNNETSISIVRVIGNNIEYIKEATPEKIFKVTISDK